MNLNTSHCWCLNQGGCLLSPVNHRGRTILQSFWDFSPMTTMTVRMTLAALCISRSQFRFFWRGRRMCGMHQVLVRSPKNTKNLDVTKTCCPRTPWFHFKNCPVYVWFCAVFTTVTARTKCRCSNSVQQNATEKMKMASGVMATRIQGVLRASHIYQYFWLAHIFGFHTEHWQKGQK